jgi:hypothetical protein
LVFEVGFAIFDKDSNTMIVKRVPISEVKRDRETLNKINAMEILKKFKMKNSKINMKIQ